MKVGPGARKPTEASILGSAEKMNAKQSNEMVNFQSGLPGVSKTSSDMHDLLDHKTQEVRAAEAVGLFYYKVKKWIDSFAVALGGLDTPAFAGGIGENTSLVRASICNRQSFLGIELNESRNAQSAGVITKNVSRITFASFTGTKYTW